MKPIFSLLAFSAALLFAAPNFADDINYFAVATEEEISEALEKLNVSDCAEFLETHLEPSGSKYNLIWVANAYDVGLCGEQNLELAKKYYEERIEEGIFTFLTPLRLALIYSFGPQELRNTERADYMYKQTAIILSFVPREITPEKAVQSTLQYNPIPQKLEHHIKWYQKALAKPEAERKALYLSLQKQGFQDIGLLWDETSQYKPIKIE